MTSRTATKLKEFQIHKPSEPSGDTEHPHCRAEITCYAVPGLGATGDLFSHIKLPPWITIQPITWEPCHAKESMADYAQRLASQVQPSRPHIYLGVSFGAAVAIELAKRTKPLLTIIISGVTQRREIPFYLRYLRALGAYNLAPLVVRIWTPLLRWGAAIAFGTKDPDVLKLLVRMIHEIDPTFYECGLKGLMHWKNDTVPEPLLHIHGSRDLLLPVRCVDPDIVIQGGGHMIVCTHGPELSSLITEAVERAAPQPAENNAQLA